MTPSHIALLNFVMKNYHLPDPIFVNEGIAIGLSYGYYNACNSHKDSTEYVLFVNCGADTVVFSLICFQRRQMSLIYTTNKQGCGSRYYSKAMFDLILDKVPELKEEVLHSSLLRLRFLEMAEKAKRESDITTLKRRMLLYRIAMTTVMTTSTLRYRKKSIWRSARTWGCFHYSKERSMTQSR